MKGYQKVIINILKASIHGQKFKYEKNNINWPILIKEAREHDISSLIYYSLDRNYFKNIDVEILKEWKKEVLLMNLVQRNHINNISNIVDDLNKQGIEIIVLKGIVLREFYPKPELRTMGDGDILIKKGDYDKVSNYLVSKGYRAIEEEKHPVHQGFLCKGKLEIEVHWKLINNKYFNGQVEEFENNLWNNCIEVNVNESKTKMLSINDFLLHMCLHMAVHAKYKGFGLRQLYDLSVFIRDKYEEVDWDGFIKKADQYKMLKFTRGLIFLCSKLFEIKIPKKIMNNNIISNKELDLLLESILGAGVYGTKEGLDDFHILYRYGTNESHVESNLLRIIKFLFPSKDEMPLRYYYLKKYNFLLPIAWIHRAFRGIYVKYGFIDIFKNARKSIDLGEQRNKLIKSFEL